MLKKCPFCREEIQEDAIKCKHCSSLLVPLNPQEKKDAETPTLGPDQVQYILDKGLIRFGKFVLGALTIFIAAGAYLWGYDVKNADEEARKYLNEMKDARAETKKEKDSVTALIAEVRPLFDSLSSTVDDAKRLHGVINEDANEIQTLKYAIIINNGNNGSASTKENVKVPASPNGTYMVTQIAQSYNFPVGYRGKGQTIGLLEFGGGFQQKDLSTYFSRLNLPMPHITAVGLDGQKNKTAPDISDEQVMMDIEIAGTVAPEANIVVYFSNFTEKGWVEALSAAINDRQNQPSVLCIGWGYTETETWKKDEISHINNVLLSAAASNLTIVVACGTWGASNMQNDGKPHVDFPATSPYVLACGGTELINGKETVWNDGPNQGAGGGGESVIFPVPEWQKNVSTGVGNGQLHGRGIPDVAASASGSHGYQLYIAGKWGVFGGTAAAAPLWGGLVALINQRLGRRIGYITPLLYQNPTIQKAFKDITEGNNANVGGFTGYKAGLGWDACSGWGSPNGAALLAAFQGLK